MTNRSRGGIVALALVCAVGGAALTGGLGTHRRTGGDGRAVVASAPSVGAGIRGLESAPAQPAAVAAAAATAGPGRTPGYRELVAEQARRPKQRFTPCNLVTTSEAATILGGPIRRPVEAPQGPTCIYRSATGNGFTTLEVQRGDVDTVARQLRGRRRVVVSGRSGYCGTAGRPVLYLPVPGGRVLGVSSPCGIARRFAARAAPRLGG